MSNGQRRLAAIMFTDMVGYTALTQSDEKQSLEVLDRHNRLLRPFFPKFHGREIKTIGDSFMVEFDSALDATNCAVEIQRFLHDYNISSRDEWKITLRIGIHLGDVMHRGDDILGDAVNIASRLQPLAEPEGICVSDQVFGQVRNKIQQTIVKLAPQDLKNVRFPVDVYRVVMPWERESVEVTQQLDSKRIAVLPFANMSPDPNDEYFADGLTEELISTMSRISGLKVIARTSVMAYKGVQKTIDEIARKLGVGTVLEGSVRKAGDRLRITVQLINSQTSDHIWSESYDRELKDVFAVQSEISETVAGALKVQLLSSEKERLENTRAVNPEGYTLYLKGRFYWNERTEDSMHKAIRYFERAVEVDPDLALAYSGLSDCYGILLDFNWMPPDRAGPLALQYARRALELDGNLAEAHASLALTLMNYSWDFAVAERELQRAIEVRPNYAPAHHWYAVLMFFLRRHRDSYVHEKQAIDVDPQSRVIQMGLAMSVARLGETDEALRRLESLIEANPDFAAAHSWKSSIHLWRSEYDAAITEAKKAAELDGSTFLRLSLAEALALGAKKAEAQEILDQVLKEEGRNYVSPVMVAGVEFALGRWDEGFKGLEKGMAERDNGILYFGSTVNPAYAKYRSDPRWKEIDAKLGLLQVS